MDRKVIILCLQREDLYGQENSLSSPYMDSPLTGKHLRVVTLARPHQQRGQSFSAMPITG